MNQVEKEVLNIFKLKLTKKLPVHKIILFGSRARGDAEYDSDIDVMVILKGKVGADEKNHVSDCAWEAGYEQGIVIVPITVSKQKWEKSPLKYSLLALAVNKEGVEV
jgi:uncharacterized protein